MNNHSLKKQNYSYQETKDLFVRERSQAKKHLYYATLRLQFLDWLERGWMDEFSFTVETPNYDVRNLEETMAWQEAVLMLANEIREDEFFVDVVGNTNNYSITWAMGQPPTKEQKDSIRKLIKEHTDSLDVLDYKNRTQLDEWFHLTLNLKSKEKALFHPKYAEFQKMVKEHLVKGDTWLDVVAKFSKASPKLKNKSPLQVFLDM